MGNGCVVKQCKNKGKSISGVKFHWFPKNVQEKIKWEEWVSAQNERPFKAYKTAIICNQHFDSTAYIDGVLRWKAVPSVPAPHPASPPFLQAHQSCDGTLELLDVPIQELCVAVLDSPCEKPAEKKSPPKKPNIFVKIAVKQRTVNTEAMTRYTVKQEPISFEALTGYAVKPKTMSTVVVTAEKKSPPKKPNILLKSAVRQKTVNTEALTVCAVKQETISPEAVTEYAVKQEPLDTDIEPQLQTEGFSQEAEEISRKDREQHLKNETFFLKPAGKESPPKDSLVNNAVNRNRITTTTATKNTINTQAITRYAAKQEPNNAEVKTGSQTERQKAGKISREYKEHHLTNKTFPAMPESINRVQQTPSMVPLVENGILAFGPTAEDIKELDLLKCRPGDILPEHLVTPRSREHNLKVLKRKIEDQARQLEQSYSKIRRMKRKISTLTDLLKQTKKAKKDVSKSKK